MDSNSLNPLAIGRDAAVRESFAPDQMHRFSVSIQNQSEQQQQQLLQQQMMISSSHQSQQQHHHQQQQLFEFQMLHSNSSSSNQENNCNDNLDFENESGSSDPSNLTSARFNNCSESKVLPTGCGDKSTLTHFPSTVHAGNDNSSVATTPTSATTASAAAAPGIRRQHPQITLQEESCSGGNSNFNSNYNTQRTSRSNQTIGDTNTVVKDRTILAAADSDEDHLSQQKQQQQQQQLSQSHQFQALQQSSNSGSFFSLPYNTFAQNLSQSQKQSQLQSQQRQQQPQSQQSCHMNSIPHAKQALLTRQDLIDRGDNNFNMIHSIGNENCNVSQQQHLNMKYARSSSEECANNSSSSRKPAQENRNKRQSSMYDERDKENINPFFMSLQAKKQSAPHNNNNNNNINKPPATIQHSNKSHQRQPQSNQNNNNSSMSIHNSSLDVSNIPYVGGGADHADASFLGIGIPFFKQELCQQQQQQQLQQHLMNSNSHVHLGSQQQSQQSQQDFDFYSAPTTTVNAQQNKQINPSQSSLHQQILQSLGNQNILSHSSVNQITLNGAVTTHTNDNHSQNNSNNSRRMNKNKKSLSYDESWYTKPASDVSPNNQSIGVRQITEQSASSHFQQSYSQLQLQQQQVHLLPQHQQSNGCSSQIMPSSSITNGSQKQHSDDLYELLLAERRTNSELEQTLQKRSHMAQQYFWMIEMLKSKLEQTEAQLKTEQSQHAEQLASLRDEHDQAIRLLEMRREHERIDAIQYDKTLEISNVLMAENESLTKQNAILRKQNADLAADLNDLAASSTNQHDQLLKRIGVLEKQQQSHQNSKQSSLSSQSNSSPQIDQTPQQTINTNSTHMISQIMKIVSAKSESEILKQIQILTDERSSTKQFVDCIAGMVLKCAPPGYFVNSSPTGASCTAAAAISSGSAATATPTLKQSWKFLKSVMQKYIALKANASEDSLLAEKLSDLFHVRTADAIFKSVQSLLENQNQTKDTSQLMNQITNLEQQNQQFQQKCPLQSNQSIKPRKIDESDSSIVLESSMIAQINKESNKFTCISNQYRKTPTHQNVHTIFNNSNPQMNSHNNNSQLQASNTPTNQNSSSQRNASPFLAKQNHQQLLQQQQQQIQKQQQQQVAFFNSEMSHASEARKTTASTSPGLAQYRTTSLSSQGQAAFGNHV